MSRASRIAALAALLTPLAATCAAGAAESARAVILGRLELAGQCAHLISNPRRSEMIASGEFGLSFIEATTNALRRARLGGSVGGIVASADGATVYVTQPLGGEAVAVDTQTHEVRSLVEMGTRKWPLGLTVSPDGTRLLAPSLSATIVYDVRTYQEIDRWRLPFDGPMTFAPDGLHLYVTGADLVALDPKSGRELWALRAPARVGNLVLAPPDGRSGYLTEEMHVLSVDLVAQRICQRRALPGPARALALNGEGNRLFALTADEEILVVDAREFSCPSVAPAPGRPGD